MKEYMEMLGKTVRDKVTKFEGVVSSVSFDLYGCVQCVVMPDVDENGKPKNGQWFDEKRLEVINHTRVMEPPAFMVMPARSEHGPAEKPHVSTKAR